MILEFTDAYITSFDRKREVELTLSKELIDAVSIYIDKIENCIRLSIIYSDQGYIKINYSSIEKLSKLIEYLDKNLSDYIKIDETEFRNGFEFNNGLKYIDMNKVISMEKFINDDSFEGSITFKSTNSISISNELNFERIKRQFTINNL